MTPVSSSLASRGATAALFLTALSCQDLSNFKNDGDHYEGLITQGTFVRTGFGDAVRMCLTLDTDKLQQEPGILRTSDGVFKTGGVLRAVPQTFHDPVSTFTFGQGREKNYMYFTRLADNTEALAVLSLMKGGDIEVRIMRGAPGGGATSPQLFGVFPLKREPGACSF